MSALIDKKYINLVSPQLQRFKWKSESLANCRCPLCGDSQKNKTKARGFFFPKKNDYFYKCHNCGIGHTIYKFLEIVAPVLCREYALERWRNGENGHSNYTKPIETEIIKPKIRMSLPKVSELPPDHAARVYLESRKIPCIDRFYFSDGFGDWVRGIDPTYSTVPNDERIVIPFLNKSGELLGVQGRAIGGSKNAIRYITVKFVKNGRIFFGGDTVDYSRRVYATEGPIDSVFLDNGIAFAGSEVGDIVRGFNDVVIVLDNEPRNREIVEATREAIEAGHQVCVWDIGILEKDINDMVLSGKSPHQIREDIDRYSCTGMEARLRWSQWKRI
jgi:hypothetical protein